MKTRIFKVGPANRLWLPGLTPCNFVGRHFRGTYYFHFQVKSMGEKVVQLYRWIVSCVSEYMTIIVDIVQQVFQTQRFGNWVRLHHQVLGRKVLYSVGP